MESYSPNLLADISFTKMLADFFSQFFLLLLKFWTYILPTKT